MGNPPARGAAPRRRRPPSPHAHMPGLSESSSRAQTQTARRGGARSTHARRTGRSNTRARGTYLYTPARGHDQVCVVTYTHVDALAQMRTRAHAGNQSVALLGPHPPWVRRPHFCTLRAERHFELQGKQLALACDSVAAEGGHHCPSLPSLPPGAPERAGDRCRPSRRGNPPSPVLCQPPAPRPRRDDNYLRGFRCPQASPGLAAPSVERGGTGRSRSAGAVWVGASPRALPGNSAHVPSLRTLPAAAANAPLKPGNTRSHLQGLAHAVWKTLTEPSKPSDDKPSSRRPPCLPRCKGPFAKTAQLPPSLYVM